MTICHDSESTRLKGARLRSSGRQTQLQPSLNSAALMAEFFERSANRHLRMAGNWQAVFYFGVWLCLATLAGIVSDEAGYFVVIVGVCGIGGTTTRELSLQIKDRRRQRKSRYLEAMTREYALADAKRILRFLKSEDMSASHPVREILDCVEEELQIAKSLTARLASRLSSSVSEDLSTQARTRCTESFLGLRSKCRVDANDDERTRLARRAYRTVVRATRMGLVQDRHFAYIEHARTSTTLLISLWLFTLAVGASFFLWWSPEVLWEESSVGLLKTIVNDILEGRTRPSLSNGEMSALVFHEVVPRLLVTAMAFWAMGTFRWNYKVNKHNAAVCISHARAARAFDVGFSGKMSRRTANEIGVEAARLIFRNSASGYLPRDADTAPGELALRIVDGFAPNQRGREE